MSQVVRPEHDGIPADASSSAMALLRQGVPLSLLLDLVLGPASEDLISHEQAVPA